MTDIEKYYNEEIKSFAGQPFHQLTEKQINCIKTSFSFIFWKWTKHMSEVKNGVKKRFSF